MRWGYHRERSLSMTFRLVGEGLLTRVRGSSYSACCTRTVQRRPDTQRRTKRPDACVCASLNEIICPYHIYHIERRRPATVRKECGGFRLSMLNDGFVSPRQHRTPRVPTCPQQRVYPEKKDSGYTLWPTGTGTAYGVEAIPSPSQASKQICPTQGKGSTIHGIPLHQGSLDLI